MKAIVVREHGGPEVLEVGNIEDPLPEPDEAVVDVAAAGVNFMDTYHRSGSFHLDLPFVPGSEATGTVSAVGSDVSKELIGRRVAFVTYASLQGTYAERVRVKAWRLVPIGDDVTDPLAASTLMTGMTAHYLSHDLRRFAPGEWALVHAAAGGVGSLLVQLLSRLGVRTIGAVSSTAKAELALGDGAEVALLSTDDWVAEAKRLTGGRGVDVVFDSVGKDTFDRSLDCLRRRGWMVLYGISSGAPRDLPPEELLHRGSLTLTRPGLSDFTATPEALQERAARVFELVQRDELRIRVQDVLPLTAAAEAHRRLEARATTGKLVLQVGGTN